MKDYSKMTKPQLLQETRERKLSISGTKDVLIKRLQKDDNSFFNYIFSSRWFKEPYIILKFFILYLKDVLEDTIHAINRMRRLTFVLLSIFSILVWIYYKDGSHQLWITKLESIISWYGWWTILGILSSIGLGTGLHTFILFLGPFIAETTLTAYNCQSLDFEIRGLNSFTCPETFSNSVITILSIANKIKYECFFWGLGTAIGELPPYFVARAAAAAGKDNDDFVSIEKILEKEHSKRTFSEAAQVAIHSLLKTTGFFGILLCASIPNPLFDLAGIICGHFGIPFITFFGATFIGKAIIKTSIQSFAIVTLFSKTVLEQILYRLLNFAPTLHDLFSSALRDSAAKFSNSSKSEKEPSASILGMLWNGFLFLMVLYFLLSIIESLSLTRMRKNQIKNKH